MFKFLKNLLTKKQPEKKLVLTEVFPPDIKPVRSGVYLTSISGKDHPGGIGYYRNYDAILECWSNGKLTAYEAATEKPFFKSDIFFWRGVLNAQ